MADLELTDEQAEKLNRALAGEEVELDDAEAALLTQAMGPPEAQPVTGEPAAFSPKSISGTALRGFGQGASYGFGDELAGVVQEGVKRQGAAFLDVLKTGPGRALVRRLAPGLKDQPDVAIDAVLDHSIDQAAEQVLGAKPREAGGAGVEGAGYELGRDQARRDNAEAQDANPGTYFASNVVGNMMAPGPKGGPVTIGSAVLKPWAGRALTGAAVGGANALGTSEGKTAGDVAADVGIGAGFGGVAAPVIGAVTDKAGGALARWLEQRSRQNALKAIGLAPGITDKARQLGIDNADDLLSLGAKARDEAGLIKPFGTPAGVAQRAEGMLEDAAGAKSSAIEELQKMAEQQGRGFSMTPSGPKFSEFDFNKLATKADDVLRPAQGWDPLSRQSAGKAMDLLGTASSASGGFPMAEQVRRAAGKRIPWKAPAFGQALPEEVAMMRKAYGGIADEIAEQAKDVEAKHLIAQGRVPHPEDLGASNQVAAMNKRIATLLDINTLANANSTREVAKGGLSLPGMLAGVAAGGGLMAGGNTLGGLAAGAGLAGLGSLARTRLPSAMTFAQHGAARALPGAAAAAEMPLIRTATGDRLSRAYKATLEKYGLEEPNAIAP